MTSIWPSAVVEVGPVKITFTLPICFAASSAPLSTATKKPLPSDFATSPTRISSAARAGRAKLAGTAAAPASAAVVLIKPLRFMVIPPCCDPALLPSLLLGSVASSDVQKFLAPGLAARLIGSHDHRLDPGRAQHIELFRCGTAIGHHGRDPR